VIARPAVYSRLSIDTWNALDRLFTLFRNDTRKSRASIGIWVTTLSIGIEYRRTSLYWTSFIPILLNMPNLHDFRMSYGGIREGLVELLLHENRTSLTHIAMIVFPEHTSVLALLSQFETLEFLSLGLEGSGEDEEDDLESLNAYINNLQPLCLPLLERLIVYGLRDFAPTELGDIVRYLGRSQFRVDCKIKISLNLAEEFLPLLDPLFAFHASKSVYLTWADDHGDGGLATSTIFSRSEKVILGRMPSPRLFGVPRFPQEIEITVHTAVELGRLWEALDVLSFSPHYHKTRLTLNFEMNSFSWDCSTSFFGPTLSKNSYLIDPGSAQLVGRLLQYVRPLQRKGVDIVDDENRTFQEHFRDLLM
jgi:hypothetical protein